MAKLGLQQSPLEAALQQAESVSYGLPDDLKKQFEQERINAESRRKNTDQQYDARVLDLSSRNSAVTGGATWDGKLTGSTSFIKNNPDVFAGYSPQQMHWIAAISAQESAGNPTARSPVGAFGLMQVMPDTGQNPGYGIKPLRDGSVRENVRLGLGKFEAMMSRFNGDVDKALAAYNAGEGNVDKAVARARKYGGDWKAYLPRPQETIPYINNVKGYYNAIGSKGGVPTSAAQPAPTKQATTADSRYRPLSETELKRMQEAQAQGLDTFVPFAGAKPIKIGQQPGKKAPKQENEDVGFLSDTGNLLLSGVNSSVEAAHEIAGRLPGISIGAAALDKIEEYFTGKTPQQIFKEVDEKYNKKLSNETAEARKKRWIIEPGDDLGNGKKAIEYSFGDAWKDPRAYYAGIVESAPEMVATMGGSLMLAKGAFKAALKSGATREVAAKKAATTATIAGGLLEGSFGGAHASGDVRKEIKGMSADMLKNSEAMKTLMSEGKTFEQARDEIANDAATKAFVLAGVGTGIFGGMGDRALAQIITKGTSGRLKSVAMGAVAEGLLEEMPQSALQQMAHNYAVQDADPNRPLSKGVANAAAGGAVLGGIMGGGIGAVAHRGGVEPVPAEQTAEEVPQAAAEAPVQDVVPEQPIQVEQPPRKVGPLERALGGEESLNTAIDNEIAAVAADQWLGVPGTVTKISPKADPESVYTVTVEGYENGEVFARDQDGTPMQFGQDDIVSATPVNYSEIPNSSNQDNTAPSGNTRTDGETEFLTGGATIVHGSGNSDLKAEDVTIVRVDGQKQGKKGRKYGGFYGTSEADASQAEGYAEMMGGSPTLYDVKIKAGTKVLKKTGDVTRLSENYINELVAQGYGVVVGKDPRGRTEYVVIDKNAIESMNARPGKNTGTEQGHAPDLTDFDYTPKQPTKAAEDPNLSTFDTNEGQSVNPEPVKKVEIEQPEKTLGKMSEDELRARLKYLADQARLNGGWDKRLMGERRKVEKALANLAKAQHQVEENQKPPTTADAIKHGMAEISRGMDEGARNQVAEYIREGNTDRLTYRKEDAINAALSNPNYNVQRNDDGSVTVIGVKTADGAWHGVSRSDAQPASSFKDQILDAHVNNPAKKAQIIADEIKATGRTRSQVLADVKRIVDAYEAGSATPADQKVEQTAEVDKAEPVTQKASNAVEKNEASLRDAINSLSVQSAKEARQERENGGDQVTGISGDASVRFNKKVEEQYPELFNKAQQLASKASTTAARRGNKYFHHLSFDTAPDYSSDPFPKKPTKAEVLQEAIWLLARNDNPTPSNAAPSVAETETVQLETKQTVTQWKEDMQEALAKADPEHPLYKKLQASAKNGLKSENDRQVALRQAREIEKQEQPAPKPKPSDFIEVISVGGKKAPTAEQVVQKSIEPKAETDQFADNKLFTADKVAAARARLKSKFGRLNSGIDPEVLIDGMTIAGAYIESGVRKFSDYSKAMIEDLGDGVKPYLLSFWEGARNYPGLDTTGMTSVEDSAKEHAALLKPADIQTEAVGQIAEKPKARTKKTGAKGDMVLTQDWGVEHIDGYSQSNDRESGNDTKDALRHQGLGDALDEFIGSRQFSRGEAVDTGTTVDQVRETLIDRFGKDVINALESRGLLRIVQSIDDVEGISAESLMQRAWHGTPHKGIEKTGFKLSKIGTGEGVQIYGHGIYFAGSRDVSEWYRRNLSGFDSKYSIDGGDIKPLSALNDFVESLDKTRSNFDEKKAEYLALLTENYNSYLKDFDSESRRLERIRTKLDNAKSDSEREDLHYTLKDALNFFKYMEATKNDLETLKRATKDSVQSIYAGQLYSAEIPESDELLDWDNTLDEQPSHIREALQNVFDAIVNNETDYAKASQLSHELTVEQMNSLTGEKVYRKIADLLGSAEKASQALLDAGIVGLQYLDGNSRAIKDGTHNFVIWDESLLNNDIQAHYSRSENLAGIEGVYQNGQVTLIAGNLTADTTIPTFLHELGGHLGMQGVMKPNAYKSLMDQFNRLVKAEDPIALEAKRLAERETDPNVRQDEYLPYLITAAARAQNKRPGIRTLINRIVAAVKAWAFDKFGVNINLNANDVLALAERMVNTIGKASGTGPRRFSREDQTNTPEFKKWFGDSKVVDANGNPQIRYHGTRDTWTQWDKDRAGGLIHTTDSRDIANDYAQGAGGGRKSVDPMYRDYYGNTYRIDATRGDYVNQDGDRLSVHEIQDMLDVGDINAEYEDARVMSIYVKAENPLNLKTPAGLKVLAGIQANTRLGQGVVDAAADGQFNWNSTKHEHQRKHWANDLVPKLKAQGYDAIIFSDDGHETLSVFDSEQIKSATDNTGAFDANNPDIRFSRRDEDLAPVSEQEYASKLSQWWSEAKKLPSDKLTKLMTDGGLGLIPLRPMLTEMAKDIPAATSYLRIKDAMDAMRNKWHAKTDAVAQEWLKYRIKNKEENRELMDLMHESTLNQVDPSMPFQSLMTPKERMALQNPGLNANLRLELTAKMELDAKREEAYDVLKSRYDSLSSEAQSIYKSVRDAYTDLADAFDETLLKNMEKAINVRIKKAEREHSREMARITDEGLQGQERDDAIAAADRRLKNAKTKIAWNRKARMTQLRKQFETQRLAGPYFPLARFGNLFVTVRDAKSGEVVSFSRFEDPTEQRQFAEEMRKDKNYKVEEGALIGEAAVRKAVDPNFVADVEDILADLPNAEQVKDEVWQRYLESLPDMSVRKARIHRKGRAGFNADAVRAFGHHMFHGSHQLARMAHSMDLEDALDESRDQARETKDPVRSSLIVNEMEKRHQFIMNPTGGALAQWASSFAFVWYLAGSPKAAIMNLFQTPIMATPILGAYAGGLNGVARAGKELIKAAIDFTKGKGFAEHSSSLTAEERQAMADGYETGVLERTQGHDLAGVGETGVEYSAARERAMKFISWGFHHTERMNREVTFLAAYRLARAKGLSHEAAVGKAGELTWKSHFDYSNTSRPRLMHSDTMKVLLVFRNFQINMLYRLFRDVHQAVNGESKEVRREALAHLAGITGMMMLNAGITGTWLFGIAMVMAGMFMEDGEEPDEELKKAMVKVLGPRLAGMALHGLPGYITGTSLSGSVGMPDLWFRSPDSEKEGQEALQYWQSQLLGAVPGIAAQFVSGWDKIKKGEEYRGIETMMPKMFKDPMKAYRYMTEGAKNMRGDTVTEVTNPDVIKQALGFTPARIAEQYKINNASYNKQQLIAKQRKEILDMYYKAYHGAEQVDEKLLDKADAKRDAFNDKYPEKVISGPGIKRSIDEKIKGGQNAVGGMRYDRKLRDRLIEDQSPSIYGE